MKGFKTSELGSAAFRKENKNKKQTKSKAYHGRQKTNKQFNKQTIIAKILRNCTRFITDFGPQGVQTECILLIIDHSEVLPEIHFFFRFFFSFLFFSRKTERTSPSFVENQPMHRKGTAYRFFLSPFLLKIT